MWILVATPNDNTQTGIALRAMEAVENVIVEKPATLSLKELTELEDMAGKTGQFLTVHQNRRWDEDLLTVREILKDQTMGEIFRIESWYMDPVEYRETEKRKSTRRRNGAGLGRPPL
ncbi:MAG: Gfo/Idh/MocA family oxidoreductase [Mediterraneibacter gnavus]